MEIAVYVITALLLLAAAYVVFRIFVCRDYRRKGRLTPFSIILQILLFFLHALSSYLYLDSKLSNIRTDSALYIMAIVCMAAGLVLFALAMTNLGIGKSFCVDVTGLKQTGFYRYTRNPQLVAYSLFLIGYALLWPSWTGLIWIGLLWALSHMMVLTEEEHLRRTFGEEYDRYRAKTPRYLGLLKR